MACISLITGTPLYQFRHQKKERRNKGNFCAKWLNQNSAKKIKPSILPKSLVYLHGINIYITDYEILPDTLRYLFGINIQTDNIILPKNLKELNQKKRNRKNNPS